MTTAQRSVVQQELRALLQTRNHEALAQAAALACEQWPLDSWPWHYRGLAALATGQGTAAVDHLRQALRLAQEQDAKSDPATLCEHLAFALILQGSRPSILAALDLLDERLHDEPRRIPSLASATLAALQIDAAPRASLYAASWIQAAPHDLQALRTAAQAFARVQDFEAARAALERARSLAPDDAALCNDLAAVCLDLQQPAAAQRWAQAALELTPGLAAAHNNLAVALGQQGHVQDALGPARTAARLAPGDAQIVRNLGHTLLQAGRFGEASHVMRAGPQDRGLSLSIAMHAAAQHCETAHVQDDLVQLARELQSPDGQADPFAILALDLPEARALQRRVAAGAAQRVRGPQDWPEPLIAPRDSWPPTLAGKILGRPLRIAYLSADFHDHATLHLLAGVLRHHDPLEHDVRLYRYGPQPADNADWRALQASHVTRDLTHLSDRDAARAIAADEVDVLIDLKGYTRHGRPGINAWRPAPVIVNWLGYPGTLGERRLADVLIADAVVIPPEHEADYAEQIVRMPHCYLPGDNGRALGAAPSRASQGLPEDRVVFCCFNQAYKLTPRTLDLWGRILGGAPQSVLWLLDPGPQAGDRLRNEMARRNVPASRLVLAPPVDVGPHLARLQCADLALDTCPCGSHTTGSDALWAGVPLLAHTGSTFAGRVSTSLVHALGLPDLACADDDAYAQRAVELALSPQRLSELRARVARARLDSPLFDSVRFTRNLEALLRRVCGYQVPAARPRS